MADSSSYARSLGMKLFHAQQAVHNPKDSQSFSKHQNWLLFFNVHLAIGVVRKRELNGFSAYQKAGISHT